LEVADEEGAEGSDFRCLLAGVLVRLPPSFSAVHGLTTRESVCIASFIRIYYMIPLKHNLDVTWIMGDVYVWSSVEPCMGILCACLPTLQPLIRRVLKKIMGSSIARGRLGGNSRARTSSSVQRRSKVFSDGSGKRGRGRGMFQQLDELGSGAGESSTYLRRGLGLRPEGDETLLTTASTTAHVEMEDLQKRDSNGIDAKGMGIQVKTDFQWREEHK
jgi:hypothetical protein